MAKASTGTAVAKKAGPGSSKLPARGEALAARRPMRGLNCEVLEIVVPPRFSTEEID